MKKKTVRAPGKSAAEVKANKKRIKPLPIFYLMAVSVLIVISVLNYAKLNELTFEAATIKSETQLLQDDIVRLNVELNRITEDRAIAAADLAVEVSKYEKVYLCGDGVQVAGTSGVLRSLPAGQTVVGLPAESQRDFMARLSLPGRFEKLSKKFAALQQEIAELKAKVDAE